jgi:isopentenyl diphosphate isomerase/L-lactate dehydrogenase-like FMN-dependent dehydrogenase
VASAAAATRVPFILSSVSTTTIEAVAEAMGDAPRWFQLYPTKDDDLTASLVQRAEATGYQALVITLDTTMLGWRERDLRTAYLPFLDGIGLANYLSDPVLRARLARPPEDDQSAAIGYVLNVFTNPSFDWQGVAFVRERTRLPVLLKGITHPADAAEAVERGLDGVIVSNHGGRQVDGAIAALDALPEVVAAVDGRVPVLMDSGIRRGADVLKALALGARAVCVGKAAGWGLGAAGEEGVVRVLELLTLELRIAMANTGVASLADVSRELVRRACVAD